MKEDIKQSAPIDMLDQIDLMIDKIADTVPGESQTESTSPERNMGSAEMARWLSIIKHGHLSIEVAEQIDQAVSELKYGFITLGIERHQITITGIAPCTKVTTRRGRRTYKQDSSLTKRAEGRYD